MFCGVQVSIILGLHCTQCIAANPRLSLRQTADIICGTSVVLSAGVCTLVSASSHRGHWDIIEWYRTLLESLRTLHNSEIP